MSAPYQQIAAGIRKRISTGELAPGDRVPSTRELMREYGVALATRRIASELGVSTMGLYRHVGGKDSLVLQMVDRAFADFPVPPGEPASWREGIETAARLQWAAYRRHLWLPGAITLSR